MELYELERLARHARHMRETGIGLLLGSLVLTVFLFVPLAPPASPMAQATPLEATSTPPFVMNETLEAKAAIVYDLVTKDILYAKNADAQLPLASLTKLLTVYAALAELSPDTPITIPADVTVLAYPRAFNEGQVFSLNDLARLTLTASLNDGAVAIARAAAERQKVSEGALLASAAAALDLSSTYAVNGSGLDETDTIGGGYGSAHDLAILAGALMQKAPAIAEATTQESATALSLGGTRYTVKNTDPITETIPGLLLSKTGYTELAGGNLVIVFDASIDHPVAIVVLGSTQKARFTDTAALVKATLSHFATIASL